MGSARILIREVQRLMATRGLLGGVMAVARTLFFDLVARKSSGQPGMIAQPGADREFDRRYGVDTSGIIRLSNLEISAANWVFGERYEPIDNHALATALAELDLPLEQFVFVDLGSGKGRAVLLASCHPFKKVVGVEFSPELTAIAGENLGRFPVHERKCDDIQLVCMDAAGYIVPDDPLVLFMFNPFRRPVMEKVVQNLESSLRRRPRRVVILYFTHAVDEAWREVSMLRLVKETPRLKIFDSDIDSRHG